MIKDFSKYINNIPILPEVAMKVLHIAEEKISISFKDLENIIKMDPGLTSKILKVANSALYARQTDVTSLQIAITFLGFKNIKSLVLLVTASRFFQRDRSTDFYKSFWRHSIVTAFLGKRIALATQKNDIAESVFIGGLLHNIGQALLYNADKKKYEEVFAEDKAGKDFIEVYEERAFGTNHRKIGAELFRKWNIPEVYADIAQEHNSLYVTSHYKTTIHFVTVAGLIAEKAGYGNYGIVKENLLTQLLPHISLSEEDVQLFADHLNDFLRADPLFLECQALFGLV